jgi:hypothetical protein
MSWVLILLFNVDVSKFPVTPLSTDFTSQETCINAGEKVREYWKNYDEGLKPKYICVPK